MHFEPLIAFNITMRPCVRHFLRRSTNRYISRQSIVFDASKTLIISEMSIPNDSLILIVNRVHMVGFFSWEHIQSNADKAIVIDVNDSKRLITI